ncbi:MAG: hypothetical protein QM498_03555 [Desulfobacterium sp.]
MQIKEAHKCETVEEVYACLKELDEDKQLLRNPEDVAQMEQKIMSYTNRLGALLLKKRSKLA